jgi:hypothetical protein
VESGFNSRVLNPDHLLTGFKSRVLKSGIGAPLHCHPDPFTTRVNRLAIPATHKPFLICVNRLAILFLREVLPFVIFILLSFGMYEIKRAFFWIRATHSLLLATVALTVAALV